MYRELEGLQVLTSAGGPGDAIRIHAAGELDLGSLDVLRNALDGALEAGLGDVEVELSEMTFCDSTGLCLLLTAQRTLNGAGRRLCLVNPAPAVLRLLDLSSTRQSFDIRTCSSTPNTRRRRRGRGMTELGRSEAYGTAWRDVDAATEQLYDELFARVVAIVAVVPCLRATTGSVPENELVRAAGRVVSALRCDHDPDAARRLIGDLWPTNTPPQAGHAWWSTPLGTILAHRDGVTCTDDTVRAP